MATKPLPAVNSDLLAQLTMLANAMVAKEQEIKEREQALLASKADLRAISEEHIPGLMMEIGVKALTLEDGTSVTVKNDVQASIPTERKEEAFKWLEDNGFGGLIKTEVLVVFGREELEKAVEFYNGLIEQGLQPELKRAVHWQTLNAFLREQIEKMPQNIEEKMPIVPLETFGARPITIAKLKSPKRKVNA
jgi:hypothetical protein